ncbi:helix-turn-helix domain-containing protein [Lacibacter sediminis]|uniref:Helix-turn-helix domain-containing protein n=1 Tax=Lacibacter sediminis TaxID=2760713 RepID=A0A7G5XLV5_9BACT|nr:helix-turn-helix domain-containing protein [Lacibacter sediminis]QNA46458.1 helix-turn-helix domain-containing protein [Lacibacter sediminis]
MTKTTENSQLTGSLLAEWIPRAEVMQFLGYKATQMYHFLKSGKVKTVKVGKRIFVNRKSLNDFMEAQSSQSEY